MLIAVVGGGASGMMAAFAAAKNGARVTLFDKNEKLGKKLFISGKGRCNLTNDSEISEHMNNVVTNPRFLFSSYGALSPFDLMKLVSSYGTPLKTERGGRVFPVSDKSSDVINAFKRMLSDAKVEIKLNEGVSKIEKTNDRFHIKTEKGEYDFDKVILCTGGATYRATGSTGDGYRFAGAFGHTVTPLFPALVGIRSEIPGDLAGLSLKNVELSAYKKGQKIYCEFGEMLFTHTGISGPLVLTLSSKINKFDLKEINLSIDLKPALTEETLSARLVREFSAAPNKSVKNVFASLMPRSLIPFVLDQSGVSENKACNEITKKERADLVSVIKKLPIIPNDFEEFNGAIVTSGGVKTSEVDPKDMQSKLVNGLYFAGELLDVDALTGGFNLQIAFSTGYLAGTAAANAC